MNHYQIPCASVEIEGSSYLVEIDLGSSTPLTLHKEILDKIKTEPCGLSRRIDVLGNKYETPAYFISNIKVGELLLKKIQVKEESPEFVQETTFLSDPKKSPYAGRMGRGFFTDKNLFMDFDHHVFIACSRLKDLRETGYEIQEMITIPFQVAADGIVLEIETDFGCGKFILDTGATGSFIRDLKAPSLDKNSKPPTYKTAKFSIGKKEFGPQDLYLLKISPIFEADGVLGMDFLKKHQVYLDFEKKIAYIGTPRIVF